MDASKRGRMLLKLADLMEENADYLASLETVDNGKPFTLSLADVMFASAVIRYYGGYADKVHGNTIPVDGDVFAYTRREPIGVVGQIIPIGRLILKASGDSNIKKVSLELGGKSPLIIFPDADLDLAATLAHEAVFWNQGQACCAPTRTYVHADVYDKFVAKSVELAKKRIVGDPFDERTSHGAQIDETQFDRIMEYIGIGQEEGAKLRCGGRRLGSRGYFIEPTVFSDVKDHMKIAREEIFGPVQSIFKFETTEEVIARANDTMYGLAAGLVTNDLNTANTVAHALEAGVVWVNTFLSMSAQAPFGGYKMSGIGREMGEDGALEYTEVKTIITTMPQKNS
ncbi:aldehyde dehydrogenase, mitochondrial [Ixodes scapularis]